MSNHGRPALPPELRRNNYFRIGLTTGQAADIEHISEGWNVPPAIALYGIVSTFLASIRGKGAEYSDADTIAENAARLYLSSLSPK